MTVADLPSPPAHPASVREAETELRLLYVATSGGEGGIERYSLRLATQLQARGVQIIYACRPDGWTETQCRAANIPVLPLELRNSGDLKAARRLARFLREQPIDIVHVHSRRDYVVALLAVAWAKRGRRTSPGLILHAHLIRPLGTPARLNGGFFARGADAVIVVSEAVRAILQREHGFAPSFVHLIHNGVDMDAYAVPGTSRACPWRNRMRRLWDIPSEALVIGMVGRLNAKGQEALLAVAPRLVRQFPSVHFVLVGPDGETGDRERLLEVARAARIAGRVIVPGNQEDMPAVMAAFDIVTHLPVDESFGLALVEAMAAGLPTVATRIGGCAEVVQDGVTGFLVPAGDSEALMSALSRLLDPRQGAARRAEMGIAARADAAGRFSLERQVDRLQELYQHICPTAAHSPPLGRPSRS